MTFNGIYTPIITPFDESGVIDYVKMKHNLEKWGKTDLDGIVVLGSNGEFVYLTEAEKLEVIQFAVNNFTKAKKIIAGVSCESTAETIETAKKAAALGVDAVLVLPIQRRQKDEILYSYHRRGRLNLGPMLTTYQHRHKSLPPSSPDLQSP
ncbi:MAG: dihydrodipicolinate synthase family protein [Anaerovoracaceae bacterium]